MRVGASPGSPGTLRRWAGLLVSVLAAVLIAWSLGTSGAEGEPQLAEGARATGAQPALGGRSGGSPSPAPDRDGPGAQARREREALLEEAQQRLAQYRAATRLPPHARPAREQADRMTPVSPVRERPLSLNDEEGSGSELRLRLGQSRIALAGDESVEVWLQCLDDASRVVGCEVEGFAHEAEHAQPSGGAAAPIPLTFRREHRNVDGAAPGPVWIATLTPAREGFALYRGTLRLPVKVRAGETTGQAFFDGVYTGAPPATLEPVVAESMDQGDLLLRLPIRVKEAGRYVFEARLDDAGGTPTALLTFNDVLPAGAQQLTFRLAGLLVHDERPVFPLTLRDVEGFLLFETGDPDRAHVLPLSGQVHRTRSWKLADFGRDEWQGEQRQRYLDEFSADVERAQAELDAPLP